MTNRAPRRRLTDTALSALAYLIFFIPALLQHRRDRRTRNRHGE